MKSFSNVLSGTLRHPPLLPGADERAMMPKGMYRFKTEPLPGQRAIWESSAHRPACGLFMPTGTGKSKMAIDTAAYLYVSGAIDAVIVVADASLVDQWGEDEIPKHWPTEFVGPYTLHMYRAGRSGTKRAQQELDDYESALSHCFWFVTNNEALITAGAQHWIRRLLAARRVLMVIDESTSIANPGNKRTKAAHLLRDMAPYRRVMSALPAAEGPLKLYGQLKFVDNSIFPWPYIAFKHRYALWRQIHPVGARRPVEVLAMNQDDEPAYINQEELQRRIAPWIYTIPKSEVLKNLPPKGYQRLVFEMTPKQRRIYTELAKWSIATIDEETEFSVSHVLTKLLRLQQVTSGYLPAREMATVAPLDGTAYENWDEAEAAIAAELEQAMVRLDESNARLDTLTDAIERTESDRAGIIWARFIPDLDAICERLTDLKQTFVRYDGTVSRSERNEGRRAFVDGKARWFVGNQMAGGRGLTLNEASIMFYYNNYFGLEVRLNSEDRFHRYGQQRPVTICDIMARGTIDFKLLRTLIGKRKISDAVMKEGATAWLTLDE